MDTHDFPIKAGLGRRCWEWLMLVLLRLSFNSRKREKFYFLVQSFLIDDVPLNSSLKQLILLEDKKVQRNKLPSLMRIIYRRCLASLSQGQSLQHALLMIVPRSEQMVLQVAQQSGLYNCLNYLMEMLERKNKANNLVLMAIMYPALCFGVLILMYLVAIFKMIPIFAKFLQHKGRHLDSASSFAANHALLPTTRLALYLSNNPVASVVVPLTAVALIILLVMLSLPHWRRRPSLEDYPPYNFYRLFLAVDFFATINLLCKMDYTMHTALASILPNSSRYLAYRIQLMLRNLSEGKSVGDALIELEFPDLNFMDQLYVIEFSQGISNRLDFLLERVVSFSLRRLEMVVKVLQIMALIFVTLAIMLIYVLVFSTAFDATHSGM